MALVGTAIVKFVSKEGPLLNGMKNVSRGAKSMSSGISKTVGAATKIVGTLGIALGVAGLVRVFAGAVKSAVNFEKKMAEINTLLRVTPQELKKIGGELKNVARTWGFSLDDVTNSYYDLVSAGFDAAEANRVLEASAALATGGLTSLSTATSTVISVLRAYRMEADKADQVASVLFETIKVGRLRMDDLAKAFPAVASMARAMNVPLEQASAAFATLSQTMPSAEVASVALQRAMQGLYTPTEQALRVMAKLGIETREFDAAGKRLFWTLGEQERRVGSLTSEYRALDTQMRMLSDNIDEIDIQMATLNLQLREMEFAAKMQNRQLLPQEIYLRRQLGNQLDALNLQRERLSLTEMRGRKNLDYMNRQLEAQTTIADELAAELAALPAAFKPFGEAIMQVANLAPRQMRKVLPEIRAVRAALAFDPAMYERALKQIGQAWTDATSHIEAAGEMMKTTSKSIDKMRTALEVTSTNVMEKVLPKIDSAVKAIAELADKVPEILERMGPMLGFFEKLAASMERVAKAMDRIGGAGARRRATEETPRYQEFAFQPEQIDQRGIAANMKRYKEIERMEMALGGTMPGGPLRAGGFTADQLRAIESWFESAQNISRDAMLDMQSALVGFSETGQHSFQQTTVFLSEYFKSVSEGLGGTEAALTKAHEKTASIYSDKRAIIKETVAAEEAAETTRKEIRETSLAETAYMVAEIQSQLLSLEEAHKAEAAAEGVSSEEKLRLAKEHLAEKGFLQDTLKQWSAEYRERLKAEGVAEGGAAQAKQEAAQTKIAAIQAERTAFGASFREREKEIVEEIQSEETSETRRAELHKEYTQLLKDKTELRKELSRALIAAAKEDIGTEEDKAARQREISEDIQESLQVQSPYHEGSPSLVSQVISGAAEIISTWQRTAGQLSTIWGGIVTSTRVAWEQVKAAIVGPIQIAIDWIARLYNTVSAAFLHSWFTDAMTTMATSVSEATGTVIERFKAITVAVARMKDSLGRAFSPRWIEWLSTGLKKLSPAINALRREAKFLLEEGKLDLGALQVGLEEAEFEKRKAIALGGTPEEKALQNRLIVFLKGIIDWAVAQGIQPLAAEGAETELELESLVMPDVSAPTSALMPEEPTGMLGAGAYIVHGGTVQPYQSESQAGTHIVINIEKVDSQVDIQNIAREVEDRLERMAER